MGLRNLALWTTPRTMLLRVLAYPANVTATVRLGRYMAVSDTGRQEAAGQSRPVRQDARNAQRGVVTRNIGVAGESERLHAARQEDGAMDTGRRTGAPDDGSKYDCASAWFELTSGVTSVGGRESPSGRQASRKRVSVARISVSGPSTARAARSGPLRFRRCEKGRGNPRPFASVVCRQSTIRRRRARSPAADSCRSAASARPWKRRAAAGARGRCGSAPHAEG